MSCACPRAESCKATEPGCPGGCGEVGWRTLGRRRAARRRRSTSAPRSLRRCSARAMPFEQLRASLPLNQMVVLPPPAPGRQILPYLPPDMLYAMCRYELTGGPVSRHRRRVPAPAGSLSLHTPQGDNFYVLPGQQLRRGEVSFLLVPSGDAGCTLQRRASATDTQVASPTAEGPDRGARTAHRASPGWQRPMPSCAGRAARRSSASGAFPYARIVRPSWSFAPSLWLARLRWFGICASRAHILT